MVKRRQMTSGGTKRHAPKWQKLSRQTEVPRGGGHSSRQERRHVWRQGADRKRRKGEKMMSQRERGGGKQSR